MKLSTENKEQIAEIVATHVSELKTYSNVCSELESKITNVLANTFLGKYFKYSPDATETYVMKVTNINVLIEDGTTYFIGPKITIGLLDDVSFAKIDHSIGLSLTDLNNSLDSLEEITIEEFDEFLQKAKDMVVNFTV